MPGIPVTNGATLAACLSKQNWLDPVHTALEGLGYTTHPQPRGQALEVWRPEHCRGYAHRRQFVDGWRLRNVWLGPRRTSVGVLPHRFYLLDQDRIDHRTEHEILGSESRPETPFADRLEAIKELLDRLRGIDSFRQGPVRLDATDNLLDNAMLRVLQGTYPATSKLHEVYRQGKFLHSPTELKIVLCSDEGVDEKHAQEFKMRAERGFGDCGATGTFILPTLKALEKRLSEVDQGSDVLSRTVPVLLMLADKEESRSPRMARVMKLLDRHRLPWRRAYAADPREFSVKNQLASLLQAAGGLAHAVEIKNGRQLPWSIGVDLSHRSTFSRVAAALVDPDGRFVQAWTSDQPKAENMRRETLHRLLKAAASAIPPCELPSGLLIIRDGRIFETEDLSDYHPASTATTLVEFRKYNNPPLFLEDGQPPANPACAWVPNTNGWSTAFASFLGQSGRKNAFPHVDKVHMKDKWDGLGLGREGLIDVLTAQTRTAGLGPSPRRLPAPIYWADGIAGASDADLRFRGQPVHRLD